MNELSRLFSFLEKGATVITPNNRLANELLRLFAMQSKTSLCDKPHCLPYQTFLQDLFIKLGHHQDSPLLLSPQQTQYLWTQLLTQQLGEPLNEGLLNEIQQAWTRCQYWQIDTQHPSFSFTPQYQQFQLWCKQFQAELDKLSALTVEQLTNFITSSVLRVSSLGRGEESTIIWYCFDDYTPAQLALQDYLLSQGCTQEHWDLNSRPQFVSLYAANDETAEYQQLLHWVKERVFAGDKRIGVVVPDLQTKAPLLQRLFQQKLTGSFNISLGQGLQELPLVSHALSLLQLNTEVLTNEEARLLLYSPYLGCSHTEMLARAQCLQDAPALQEEILSTAIFIKTLESNAAKLAELLKTIANYPEQATVGEWIILFKNRLTQLGFPGEELLNSASFQCYQRFLKLFDEFQSLALLSPQMSKTQALSAFTSLAKNSIFQPKTDKATVQILGLLEASGCLFDSLWVAGMTDECLPQKTKFSAFIPAKIQREQKMPHASHERELFLAAKIIERLQKSSPYCIFSYPLLVQDRPNLPSPLLAGLAPFNASPISEVKACSLERYDEDYELTLAPNESIKGGTALLANQAKCPFRAFAAHRLYAKKGLARSDGLALAERGKLIHKIMEMLWKTLRSQQRLLTLPAQELDKLVHEVIAQALQPFQQLRPHSFSELFQSVEIARLKQLIKVCLDWEKSRPPFEVEALEKEFTYNTGNMEFSLRIDRMDKVESGKKWVIDYKSTLPASMPWKEERPKEPQLLLYALLDETINVLLFAGLKEGQLTCKGLSEEPLDLTGISSIKKDEHWAAHREQWQAQLFNLANEFSQGHCPPTPATLSICQQCDYQSLCRFSKESTTPPV